ncbi:MAG: DUF4080 domain-containing protein [Ruminococcaceae bacterium]|nr:DUF4080 domain-containing protein [Oscillospiraceae bacterium]
MLLVGVNAKFIHSNLAIRYLSLLEERCSFCEFTVQDRPEQIAAKLYKTGEQVFLFSCYIWNVEHILKVCNILKQADCHIRIGLGGPEVSFNAKEYLEENPVVDFIFCGEGEPAIGLFADSLDSLEFDGVPGLWYRENGAICQSSVSALEADMDALPFPYTKEDVQKLKNRILYFETSRGCPYRCAFCLSGGAGSLRFMSLAKVQNAIDFFAEHKVPLVKLVDRTFNADPKRALAIVEAIKEKNSGTTYHFEIRAETMTEVLIESLQKAPKGMFQLEIGVQSVHPETLKKINRKPDFERLCNVVRQLAKNNNMHLHLDLIAGLPGETLEQFISSFNQLMALKPHNLQLGFLKKLKGSTLEAPGSAFWNFAPYEVIHSDAMTYGELLMLHDVEEMLERYYNSGAFSQTLDYLLSTYYAGREFDFFKEIGDFVLLEKEPKSQKAMYELLFLFAEQKFGDAEIKNRLIYDYCCVHRDALSFMQADETLKSKAFEFLKKPERVTHYFEYYAGVKPVVLYKKIRFVPIGNRVIAFDYEHGLTVDVTTEIEQEETANV